MRLIEYGEHALLAEYDTIEDVLSVAARLRSLTVAGVDDAVAAARTILVRFVVRPAGLAEMLAVEHRSPVDTDPAAVIDVAENAPVHHADVAGDPVEIAVRYDGEDLAQVARTVGVTSSEVIVLHTTPTYEVAFCGFAPGFAYLVGGPAVLHLPRRATPRTRVPAGSVAIAGPFTGVYPTPSPGGWHLLGHTEAMLFDVGRRPPALLAPGTRVRFLAT